MKENTRLLMDLEQDADDEMDMEQDENSLTPQEEEELINMTNREQEQKYEAARKKYDNIPIPGSLDKLVHETVERQRRLHQRAAKRAGRRKAWIQAGRTFGALAAAIVIFMIPLNTNKAFAAQMQNIPVIKVVARVLTVRTYEESDENTNVDAEVPEIVVLTENDSNVATADYTDESAAAADWSGAIAEPEVTYETETADIDPEAPGQGPTEFETAKLTEYAGNINDEIQKISDEYIADAQKRFADYKDAFYATGGTDEEWGGRTCDIAVSYETKFNEGSVLSLVLTTTEDWNASYGVRYFYNLDLASGTSLTLADLLGENWVSICNESIVNQIYERQVANGNVKYWGYSGDAEIDKQEGFTTVDASTSFYIRATGEPVVCFDKYEICPGALGIQEFTIPIPEEPAVTTAADGAETTPAVTPTVTPNVTATPAATATPEAVANK